MPVSRRQFEILNGITTKGFALVYPTYDSIPSLKIEDAPNFSIPEFICHCGCGEYLIDQKLIYILQVTRDILGFPLPISSGYRCPSYNLSPAVGGSVDSSHPYGQAVDTPIDPRDHFKRRLITFAFMLAGCPIIKVGKANDHIHVDVNQQKQWYTLLVV